MLSFLKLTAPKPTPPEIKSPMLDPGYSPRRTSSRSVNVPERPKSTSIERTTPIVQIDLYNQVNHHFSELERIVDFNPTIVVGVKPREFKDILLSLKAKVDVLNPTTK